MPNIEITICDIAQKLQLSPSTISRALNDDPAINHKTRSAIRQAAVEPGYRRNTFARNLRKRKTNTIGVIVHELSSNFITSALAGIEKVTTEAGYDLIIAHSSESHEKEAANALDLFHKRVDGLIASLALNTESLDHFRKFNELQIPIVFFDRVEEKSSSTKVIIDNYKCGYEATQHLIDQGCKKIVLVTAHLKRNVYAQRHQGYADALAANGIPYKTEYVLVKDLSEQAAAQAAMEILRMKPLPDGAFITNDFSAAICMQTLKKNGIQIPHDIAVVGFNNDPISTIIEPNLTTIRYPGMDMGEIAAGTMINRLCGTPGLQEIKTIVVHSDLIIRKSSIKRSKTI
jgi:LacI family transcriptional regulator